MSGKEFGTGRWVYWVLPAAFAVHDAEELATMPRWVASHRAEIEASLAALGAGEAVDALPTTLLRAGIAIGCMFVVFVAVTAGVWLRPESAAWRALYGGLLGAFFLHAFTHVGQAVVFAGYAPGVVTAVAVVVPASAFVYLRLSARGALDRGPTVAATVVALALFVPAALLAFSGAAWLAPR